MKQQRSTHLKPDLDAPRKTSHAVHATTPWRFTLAALVLLFSSPGSLLPPG
jgi:hypothetical protein